LRVLRTVEWKTKTEEIRWVVVGENQRNFKDKIEHSE
jgi:hypothetical protein